VGHPVYDCPVYFNLINSTEIDSQLDNFYARKFCVFFEKLVTEVILQITCDYYFKPKQGNGRNICESIMVLRGLPCLRDCTPNLKRSSVQRWQCPIHNGILETLIWSKNEEDVDIFLGFKVFNSDSFYVFSCSKKAQVKITENAQ